jgi:hypothetical protein
MKTLVEPSSTDPVDENILLWQAFAEATTIHAISAQLLAASGGDVPIDTPKPERALVPTDKTPLCVQFWRNGRIVSDMTCEDGHEAVAHIIVLVSGLDEMQARDRILVTHC